MESNESADGRRCPSRPGPNVEYGRLQNNIKGDETVKCTVDLLVIYKLLLLFKLLLSEMFSPGILQVS